LTEITSQPQENLNNPEINFEIKSNNVTIEADDFLKKSCSKIPNLTDVKLISILNDFIFYLFLISILIHNLLCLYFFPNFVRIPLAIDD